MSLAAGQYTLSFDAAQRGGDAGTQQIQVFLDGVSAGAGTVIPRGTQYGSYSVSLTVMTSGQHTIELCGQSSQDNTAFVDDIELNPTLGDGSFEPGNSGDSWTFSGTTGVVSNGNVSWNNPPAPDGTQAAYLQCNSSITQSVNLGIGVYTISFYAAQRRNGNHTPQFQEIQVTLDGNPVGQVIQPGGTQYALCQTTFTVSIAGSHVLGFLGLNPLGGDNTAFIDAVILQGGLSDGSFESPVLAAGTYQYTPSASSTPWVFTPLSGVSSNNSTFTSGNPAAPQGIQVCFLQCDCGVSQMVTLAAGSYAISLDAAQRDNCQAEYQEIDVLVDNVLVGEVVPTSIDYEFYQTPYFTVQDGSGSNPTQHFIEFLGVDPGGDNTALIDDVMLQQQPLNDGSFELPTIPAENYRYASQIQFGPSSQPWVFQGTAGVARNGNALPQTTQTPPRTLKLPLSKRPGALAKL